MYADPLVIKVDDVAGQTVEATFALTGPLATGSIRKNVLDDDGTKPETMKISHQVVGKGDAIRDRRMVRFEVSSVDGTEIGTHAPAVAYLVLDIPRQYKTAGIAKSLCRYVSGFIRNADGDHTPDYVTNYAKLMNGES